MQFQPATLMLQGAPQQGGMMPIVMMVGMFVVMYFFLIRPQSKRAKEQKKFSENLNSNEVVVTTAGIHGRINRTNDDGTLQMEISRGIFITIERSAVSMELTTAARKKAGITPAATETAAK